MQTTSNHDAGALCMECGLCCSGAVYTILRIEAAELEAPPGIVMKIERDDDGPFSTLPCPALSGTCCTIYTDRPRTCREFRCVTLQALDRHQLTLEAAQHRIREARTAFAACERAAGDRSILDIRKLRAELANAGFILQPAELREALNALDGILDRWFRKPEQAQLPVFAELEGRPVNPR